MVNLFCEMRRLLTDWNNKLSCRWPIEIMFHQPQCFSGQCPLEASQRRPWGDGRLPSDRNSKDGEVFRIRISDLEDSALWCCFVARASIIRWYSASDLDGALSCCA